MNAAERLNSRVASENWLMFGRLVASLDVGPWWLDVLLVIDSSLPATAAGPLNSNFLRPFYYLL